MIVSGVLKEFVQHTAFSTNSYLRVGQGGKEVLEGRQSVNLEVLSAAKKPAAAKAKVQSKKDGGAAASGNGA
eukprot:4248889-Pyramimonas_sp.AAC.2